MALRTEPRCERRLLGGVTHAHAELRPVAEVRADWLARNATVTDDVVVAVPLEQLHDVLHHRPVGDREHRLGWLESAAAAECLRPRP